MIRNWYGEVLDSETLTTASVNTFTSAKLQAASYGSIPVRAVLISAENGDVRFTQDGTTPAAGLNGNGILLANGTSRYIEGWGSCRRFKVINATASSGAVLKCQYLY